MNKTINRALSFFICTSLCLSSQLASAGLLDYFKDDEGHTKWQYVANWSSGVLILLLSITVTILFFSRRQIHITNMALSASNDRLEQRVKERTATLNESNELLKETNLLLEGEVTKHLETTKRLHASESYIKSILESMPLMLVGLNDKGEITQWNKGAEEITGLKAENALNKVLWDAYPTITVTPEQVQKAREEKQALSMRHSQRGQFHYEITLYPLDDSNENGVVILIDNVTQQVLSENKLIQKDKMSTMGELASSMAHDINAPLQAVMSNIIQARELIQPKGAILPESADTKLLTLLDEADTHGGRATATINNLLDFASSQTTEKKPVDILDVMNHSLEVAGAIFNPPQGLKFEDISIKRDFEENLPAIPCFASELQQVFLSLLRHAFYALSQVQKEDEPPQITIKILECYEALWIKVQHNGLGLTQEEQQFIFEPYFSNEPLNPSVHYNADKRLSFSYFIITEHHEGQMAVTSDVDVGTTFHMQLQLS